MGTQHEQDLSTLQKERDALLEKDVDTWLDWVKTEAHGYRQFENSISWRVTKPIRWGGDFIRKARSEGVGVATGTAISRVTSRITKR
ncbi:MAG: hypothetical protein ACOH19_02940 [Rhodoglobus sp.]